MNKRRALLCGALVMTMGFGSQDVFAARPVDNDGDGYKSTSDGNDNDNTVWVLNTCGLCEVEPVGGCGGGTNPHDGITGTFTTPAQVTAKCLECHNGAGFDIVNSLHGMMPTASPTRSRTAPAPARN